jgi:mono/diheme cytochrome c family protein
MASFISISTPRSVLVWASACAMLALACGGSDRAVTRMDSGIESAPDAVTYHGQLRALLEANCVECHHAGGIGPMPLEDWEQVKRVGPSIVAAVQARRMPPWPADDACRELADARGLSDETRAVFAAWEADGFAEGQETDYVAPAPRRRLELGEPSQMFTGDKAFTPGVNADTYRCFYVGSVASDTYLTAVDLIPEVRAEVHHVQLHRVNAEQIAAVQALQDQDAEGGYVCGSSGVGGMDSSISSQNMFSYRPGSLAVLFNQGDAAYLKRGSGLVLQIHYNTQFLPAGEVPKPDLTKLALWTLGEGETPRHVIYRTGVLSPLSGAANGNPFAFLGSTIPANEAKVIGENTLTMAEVSRVGGGLGLPLGAPPGPYIEGEIVGMTPHAHSWATRMTATIRRADGADQCLIEVPDWDYGWQLDYLYKDGLAYGRDDVLHVECHYDNTEANQPVIGGTRRVPQPIVFGENTLNEMCLHYLWLRFDYAAFAAANPG